MIGRFLAAIMAIHWRWRLLLLTGLLLCGMAITAIMQPVSPTMRAIESVGGEVSDPYAPKSFIQTIDTAVRFLIRARTPKDLLLGPYDKSRCFTLPVYNERLTDEAILEMDLSEVGPLRIANLSGPHVTDRGFVHVASNPQVANIVCRNAQVTDAGLVAMEKNPRLYSIDLTGNQITDAGVGSILRSTSLDTFQLNDTCITDHAVQEMASNGHRIHGLTIASTDVTTKGLKGLSKIQGLRAVGLDVFQFTDEAATILQPLSLTSLSIYACSDRKKHQLLQAGTTFPTRIDDQVISKVSKLRTLEQVTLCGTATDEPANLTPAAIGSLKSMPNLKYLYILDLSVDRRFLDSLQRSHPTLRIWIAGKPYNPW